jgi:formyltetrahydrofolate-dependent phosphoribosylglycinamide formyltransferase
MIYISAEKRDLSLRFLLQFCGMLHRLKEKWQVSWPRFILIFVTFALGGSACARLGSWLLGLMFTEKNTVYWLLYVPVVSLLWPLCVLIISIPLGQFFFFRNYLKKMGNRISGKSKKQSAVGSGQWAVKNIAIFASGAGSNAKRIIEHFSNSTSVKIALIVCNNSKAGVLQVAAENNIPVMLVNRKGFFETEASLDELKLHNISLVVLAGFLWMIPGYLIKAYPGRIINIHPALLPKYGGKGMYGGNVHKAVIEAGEKESGITIHYVDEHYDNGDIIFQAKCEVKETDTPDSLAERIHRLEHEHFPAVIGKLLNGE